MSRLYSRATAASSSHSPLLWFFIAFIVVVVIVVVASVQPIESTNSASLLLSTLIVSYLRAIQLVEFFLFIVDSDASLRV